MDFIENTLGSPIIEESIPITCLQKHKLKEFFGKDEIDELGGLIAKDLGRRVAELLLKIKK